MNTNGTENNFRQLFHELRDQDAHRAPSFERVLRAPPAPVITLAWPRVLLAGAVAAALVVTGVTVSLYHAQPRQLAYDAQQWAALTDWRASTDALLDMASAFPTASVPDTNPTNPQENP
jgi:hypothetical protein